jgi:hypothetical protein
MQLTNSVENHPWLTLLQDNALTSQEHHTFWWNLQVAAESSGYSYEQAVTPLKRDVITLHVRYKH